MVIEADLKLVKDAFAAEEIKKDYGHQIAFVIGTLLTPLDRGEFSSTLKKGDKGDFSN